MTSGCNCHDGAGHAATPVMGTLERPRYSVGLILEDRDLTAAVDYTRELNRLLFRSLFGCGVICGLDVTVKEDCGLVVTVNPGLGLDGCGDPLHLTSPAVIELGKREQVLPDRRTETWPKERDFWIIACNRETHCAPRSLACDDDELDCSSSNTRIRTGVEISVSFAAPKCGCGCDIYGNKADKSELNRLAGANRNRQIEDRTQACDRARIDCQHEHRHDADCAPDCGCGTACACGCCVLLGWAHWFQDKQDFSKSGWVVLHHGVRRFIRPSLICDPRWDFDKAKPGADPSQDAGMKMAVDENTWRKGTATILKGEMEKRREAMVAEGRAPDEETLARETVNAMAVELAKIAPGHARTILNKS